MPRVNLLPWRDTIRKDREQRFYISLGIAAGIVLLLVGAVQIYVNSLIDNQQRLNGILEREIAQLDAQIKEINTLQAEKEALLARMQVIQNLQATRPQSVHMFDEIVRRLPPGVFLKSIAQQGSVLTIEGQAQSNARVSTFMRNIEESEWLTDPQLNVVRSDSDEGTKVSSFTLLLKIKSKTGSGKDSEEPA